MVLLLMSLLSTFILAGNIFQHYWVVAVYKVLVVAFVLSTLIKELIDA